MKLDVVYRLIETDLARVEDTLSLLGKTEAGWLSEMLESALGNGGKRVRPVLTLLSGRFYEDNSNRLLSMAVAVELMHTATLVHDDAVDNSPFRRGKPTIYQLWGFEKAVLFGDYLFAEAGWYSAATQNLRVVELFTQTLKTISRGELGQVFSAFNLEQTREQYFQRIAAKTASLFSLSTRSGAILSRAPEESVVALGEYGYHLGIAFQVVDDILDFTSTEAELGKPVGSDLAQGTLTLPAMLLLERYPGGNPVKELFQNREAGDRQECIRRAIEMVRNSSVIPECYRVASDYRDEACRRLELLPDCPACRALAGIAEFVIGRRK